MANIKYHLFRSVNRPGHAITIGEYSSGAYFLPTALEYLPDDENTFASIEEIELFLNDKLEMIIPQTK